MALSSATATLVLLFLVILPLSAGAALQFYLSGRPEKWPGLLLPGLSFLFSCLSCLGMLLFMHAGTGIGAVIGTVLTPFLLMNLPTLLLLAIYFLRRRKYRQNSEINKMNIQDL